MNTYHVYTAHITPALNRSSTLEHFEHSNVCEMHIKIVSTWECHMRHVTLCHTNIENNKEENKDSPVDQNAVC